MATVLAILVGILLPAWTWPVLAIFWLIALWYLTTTATIAYTEVSSAGLTFVTALRQCFVPWGAVRDAHRQGGHLNLYLVDGGRIAISQYSLNPLNDWLERPRGQVADAGRLQAAVDAARQVPEIGERLEVAPHPYVRWTISSPRLRGQPEQ